MKTNEISLSTEIVPNFDTFPPQQKVELLQMDVQYLKNCLSDERVRGNYYRNAYFDLMSARSGICWN